MNPDRDEASVVQDTTTRYPAPTAPDAGGRRGQTAARWREATGAVPLAALSEVQERNVRLAQVAYRSGLVDLDTLNGLLATEPDVELATALVHEGLLTSSQLAQLLARQSTVREHDAEPTGLEVRQQSGKLTLVDPPALARLGPYRIIDRLGAGGVATVYRASHTELDRVVALKVFRPGPGQDEDVERFRREARLAATIEHPGIVRVWDVGRDRGLEYIAMDLVEGGELGRYISRSAPPLDRRLELITRVAEAVGCAHAAGLVHRDLKPANILVDGDGNPVVTDFGLARAVEDEVALTSPGMLLGTPRYMAPEQARGDAVGAPADVYAIGAILYEALGGAPMNPGRDLAETLRWAMEQVPDMLVIDEGTGKRRRADMDLQAIFFKAVEKDPALRFPDAGALAAELRRYQSGQPVETKMPGLARRALAALPAFLRPAHRSAMLAALVALLPWTVYVSAGALGLPPLTTMQLFSDVLAVGVGVTVYLALRRHRSLEAERVPLLRRIDRAERELERQNRALGGMRDAARRLRKALLPSSPSERVGPLDLVAVVEPAPDVASALVAYRAVDEDLAFVVTSAPALSEAARVVRRFDSAPAELFAQPVALFERLLDGVRERPADVAIGVGVLGADGRLAYAQTGSATRPILQPAGAAGAWVRAAEEVAVEAFEGRTLERFELPLQPGDAAVLLTGLLDVGPASERATRRRMRGLLKEYDRKTRVIPRAAQPPPRVDDGTAVERAMALIELLSERREDDGRADSSGRGDWAGVVVTRRG